jgi:hypothetical protein
VSQIVLAPNHLASHSIRHAPFHKVLMNPAIISLLPRIRSIAPTHPSITPSQPAMHAYTITPPPPAPHAIDDNVPLARARCDGGSGFGSCSSRKLCYYWTIDFSLCSSSSSSPFLFSPPPPSFSAAAASASSSCRRRRCTLSLHPACLPSFHPLPPCSAVLSFGNPRTPE